MFSKLVPSSASGHFHQGTYLLDWKIKNRRSIKVVLKYKEYKQSQEQLFGHFKAQDCGRGSGGNSCSYTFLNVLCVLYFGYSFAYLCLLYLVFSCICQY